MTAKRHHSLTRSPSFVSLIVANLIPLFGVLFFGWDIFTILFLYWMESAIVGFYNILKLAKVNSFMSVTAIPFFIVHFGLFMMVHLVFIVALFGPGWEFQGLLPWREIIPAVKSVWPAFVALFISHGVSYFTHFIGNKEYKTIEDKKLMMAPYSRIFVMHLTLIFGAFLVIPMGGNDFSLTLVILLKIALDSVAHSKEHSLFAK